MSRVEDDAILHCVEADPPEGDGWRQEPLAPDEAASDLTDDLRALVEAARSIGGAHAPEALHAQARTDVLERLQATRTGPVPELQSPLRLRSAAAWAGHLRRRRVLGYAVAATLSAVVWAGSGESVADVVAGVTQRVRILVLGRDGERLQDFSGEVHVTVDTLHLPEELADRRESPPDRPADRERRSDEETATLFAVQGGIIATPGIPGPVDSIDMAQAQVQGDTLYIGGAAGKSARSDTVRATTWGRLKGSGPHSSSGTSR